MAATVERFGLQVHTYYQMTNHYHILVEKPELNLSRAIQWLNVSYASYFNYKRDQRGHLFQGRFKSILVDTNAYLKHLSRYIHLNRSREKMVEAVADHKWSSYHAFIGKTKAPDWLYINWLLDQFGGKRNITQQKYQLFVEGADIKTPESSNSKVNSGMILGDDEFVKWVKTSFLSDRPLDPDLPQLRALRPKISFDRIIEIVANVYDSSKEQILEKGLKKNLPRDLAIYFSKVYSGMPGIEIAELFGLHSGSAITMRYNKVRQEIESHKVSDNKLSLIKQRIMNNKDVTLCYFHREVI